ncbi:MAG: PPOX class F420-dependent oxidoreductase [Dermatophilaceae bacterium]
MADSSNALDLVAEQTYVSLTTFRRSGDPVATPVWIARDGDELLVISVDGAGKTKRLRNNPNVELRPCDIRGTVADSAPVWTGTARVVRGATEVAAVKQVMGEKYLLARVGDGLSGGVEKLSRRLVKRKPRAGIRITLT